MADIYLQIMLSVANHDLSADPEAEVSRLTLGDIVGGGRATDLGTLNGSGDYIPNDVISSPRTGFVFVKDVPITAIQKIRKLLDDYKDFPTRQITVTREQYDNAIANGELGPFTSAPTVINLGATEVILEGPVERLAHRHNWGADVASIPVAVRQQMLADKYITFTWTQVKNFVRNKAEARNLADTDVA